jgi:hypothetical protein
MTKMHYLHISVLHTGTSQVCISHIVIKKEESFTKSEAPDPK